MKPTRFNTPSTRESRDRRALFFQEWGLSRGGMISLVTIWVLGLWVLVGFNHPGWLLALGGVYVMKLSSVQGGRDVIDGTEEFSFTLPPGRGPLFLARIWPGFACLTVNGLVGGLAIEYSLPQALWSHVFSSGLTDPFPAVEEPVWFIVAVLAPCAAHAITFTVAALSGSREGVNSAASVGLIGTCAVMLTGWLTERTLMKPMDPNGWFTGLALLTVAVMVPFVGYHAYLRKQTSFSNSTGFRNVGWAIATIVAAILLLLGFWFRAGKSGGVGLNPPPRGQSFSVEQAPSVPAPQVGQPFATSRT